MSEDLNQLNNHIAEIERFFNTLGKLTVPGDQVDSVHGLRKYLVNVHNQLLAQRQPLLPKEVTQDEAATEAQ